MEEGAVTKGDIRTIGMDDIGSVSPLPETDDKVAHVKDTLQCRIVEPRRVPVKSIIGKEIPLLFATLGR